MFLNSDANNKISANPSSPNYIGKHPGNAFMEVQWYSPGYVPQFDGFGCTARQYCAAMTIDSLAFDQNRSQTNNADCDNYPLAGIEPINWAYVTRSGHSQAPANPLATSRDLLDDGRAKALDPDPSKDLMMNPGDRIRIHIHDTPSGVRVDMFDLTTGKQGSMTASTANGFGQVLFRPNAKHCQVRRYAFHPMYDTAVSRGNTWAAHAINLAFSDEIGHFEYCDQIDFNGGSCTRPGVGDSTLDDDDVGCFNGDLSTLVKITGCFGSDFDFDGTSYIRDWPGTLSDRHHDRLLHEQPLMISSPVSRGRQYSKVIFETNLPSIETPDVGGTCDTQTGNGCTLPPPGAKFYPFWSTRRLSDGSCTWQQGGPFLPHINNFGGSAKTEYGSLLKTIYPSAGFQPIVRYENFRRTLQENPCPNHR